MAKSKHFCTGKAVYRVPKRLWHLLEITSDTEKFNDNKDMVLIDEAVKELKEKSKFLFYLDSIIT